MYIRPLVFRTIILFVVVNAAVGIAMVVAGGDDQLGDTDGNVLLTTLTVSGAGLLMLICFLAFEARRPVILPAFPAFVVATILIGLVLVVLHIWVDVDSEPVANGTATIAVVAVASSHICLLSMARIRLTFAWLPLLAVIFTVGLAASIVYIVWNDDREALHWRILAVLAILTAATSVLVPIVDRFLRGHPGRGSGTPRRPSYCPNCGAVLHMDEPSCLACGARFRVEFLPGRGVRETDPAEP